MLRMAASTAAEASATSTTALHGFAFAGAAPTKDAQEPSFMPGGGHSSGSSEDGAADWLALAAASADRGEAAEGGRVLERSPSSERRFVSFARVEADITEFAPKDDSSSTSASAEVAGGPQQSQPAQFDWGIGDHTSMQAAWPPTSSGAGPDAAAPDIFAAGLSATPWPAVEEASQHLWSGALHTTQGSSTSSSAEALPAAGAPSDFHDHGAFSANAHAPDPLWANSR